MPRDGEHSANSKITQAKRETQALTGTNVRKCGAAGPHSHWKTIEPWAATAVYCGIPQNLLRDPTARDGIAGLIRTRQRNCCT